jgi:hypothetical protein
MHFPNYFVLMYRYTVAREVCSVLQTSSIVLFLSSYNECARVTFLGESSIVAFSLPPNRPRGALAAVSPALVDLSIFTSQNIRPSGGVKMGSKKRPKRLCCQ